jgi:hypothetical protein
MRSGAKPIFSLLHLACYQKHEGLLLKATFPRQALTCYLLHCECLRGLASQFVFQIIVIVIIIISALPDAFMANSISSWLM